VTGKEWGSLRGAKEGVCKPKHPEGNPSH